MNHERLLEKCKAVSLQMRKDSLRMSLRSGAVGAHLGGGLSMIEIMAVLYTAIMKYDLKEPQNEERDRFILSKGHGVLALYTALNQAGFIPDEDLDTFKSNETYLYGHPSMDIKKGIEFSSGSLGQGLSLGVGTALALRHKSNENSRVYVLLGDGECDEGSVWEAAASAAHYKLSNLIAIVDENELQYDGPTHEVLSMGSFSRKFESFGWDAINVDGHSVKSLYDALTRKGEKPIAIIAHTIKGKGISFMENKREWHHSRLSQKQYEEAMQELEKEE